MFDGSNSAGVPVEIFHVYATMRHCGCYAPPQAKTPGLPSVLICQACLEPGKTIEKVMGSMFVAGSLYLKSVENQ